MVKNMEASVDGKIPDIKALKYRIQDSVVAAFYLFLNSVRARASHCGREAAKQLCFIQAEKPHLFKRQLQMPKLLCSALDLVVPN